MYQVDLDNKLIKKIYETKLGNKLINSALNKLNKDEIETTLLRYAELAYRNRNCTSCGCDCNSEAICTICGHENENLLDAINIINDLIDRLSSKRFEKEKLDPLLTKLHHIKALNIEKINKILKDNDYETTIIMKLVELKTNRDNIFNNSIKLTKEDYNFILEMLLYDDISNQYTNVRSLLLDFVIRGMVNKDENFKYNEKEMENIYRRFAERISFELVHANKLKVEFIDDERMNNCEGYFLDSISTIIVNKKTAHENPINCLVTLYHELAHQSQSVEIRENEKLNLATIIQIMDYVNRISLGAVKGDKYYRDNYHWISAELEAHLLENKMTLEYLRSIGALIPDEFIKETKEKEEVYGKMYQDNRYHIVRVVDGKARVIDEIFNENIYNQPEYLNKFKQLSMLYKVEDGHVVKKELEDLEKDYHEYKDGKLTWNGIKEEIEQLYESQINNYKIFYKNKELETKADLILDRMEHMNNNSDNVNNKQRGYTIVGILGLITCIATIGIILYGYILFYR